MYIHIYVYICIYIDRYIKMDNYKHVYIYIQEIRAVTRVDSGPVAESYCEDLPCEDPPASQGLLSHTLSHTLSHSLTHSLTLLRYKCVVSFLGGVKSPCVVLRRPSPRRPSRVQQSRSTPPGIRTGVPRS